MKKIITISNHNKDEVAAILPEYKNKITTISNGYDNNVFYKENCDKTEVLKLFNIALSKSSSATMRPFI